MKLPVLKLVSKKIAINKVAIQTALITAAVVVPTTLYIIEVRKNEAPITSDLKVAEALTQDQKSEQVSSEPVVSGNENKSQNPSSTKPASPQSNQNPTPNASTNTPSTTQPEPTFLENCFYQNGEKSGQNCPYNPPPSWSSSSLYNCYNNSGNYVACSNYRDTISIRSAHYLESGNTPTHFCIFDFKNGTYKFTRVNISSDVENIRCHSDQAFNYDPWANE